MKRIFVSLTALSLVLLSAPSASAQVELRSDNQVKTSVEVKKEIFRDLQQKFRESIEVKKESIRIEAEARNEAMKNAQRDFKAEVKTVNSERKAEKRDEKLEARVQGLVRAYMNVISHLENIITRINSRIAKVEAAGGDTATAEASIKAAQAGIVQAKLQVNALANLDLTVATGSASTTVRAKTEAAKTASSLVKQSLKSVRENLMKAVRSLNMSARADSNATTTSEQ